MCEETISAALLQQPGSNCVTINGDWRNIAVRGTGDYCAQAVSTPTGPFAVGYLSLYITLAVLMSVMCVSLILLCYFKIVSGFASLPAVLVRICHVFLFFLCVYLKRVNQSSARSIWAPSELDTRVDTSWVLGNRAARCEGDRMNGCCGKDMQTCRDSSHCSAILTCNPMQFPEGVLKDCRVTGFNTI